MDIDSTRAPHSKDEILNQIARAFGDLGVKSKSMARVRWLPLFRMYWNAEEPKILAMGWRHIVVLSIGESYVVDELNNKDSGSTFVFRRGVGLVWLNAIRRLYRRKNMNSNTHQLRCLDVPAIHQSFIWLHTKDAANILLRLHSHGEICHREKLQDLAQIKTEMQVALQKNVARFDQMKSARQVV
ncbi:MAG: hypothetical protein JWQ49_6708 [Edaphobacter sp.]|nr:hypothetical protein [Edaphobacter sp.]